MTPTRPPIPGPVSLVLSIVAGPDQGVVRRFDGAGPIRIGRSHECEFLLVEDKKVSRHQATLLPETGGAVLTYNKEDNPLHLNGGAARVGTILRDGDVLCLGPRTRVHLAVILPAAVAVPESESSLDLGPRNQTLASEGEPCLIRVDENLELGEDFLETCALLDRPILFNTGLEPILRPVKDAAAAGTEVVLRGTAGPARGREIVLHHREVYFIGRQSPPATVAFPEDASLSRNHFRLEFRDGKILLEPVTQKSETHVNGKRCRKEVELEDGDEIRAGLSRWVLLAPEEVTIAFSQPEQLHIRDAEGLGIEQPQPGHERMPQQRGLPGMPSPDKALASLPRVPRPAINQLSIQVETGPHSGLALFLQDGQSALVGRSRACYLFLPLEKVAAPVHASISFSGNKVLIKVASLSCELKVNGNSLMAKGEFNLPCTVEIGSSMLKLEFEAIESESAKAAKIKSAQAEEVLQRALLDHDTRLIPSEAPKTAKDAVQISETTKKLPILQHWSDEWHDISFPDAEVQKYICQIHKGELYSKMEALARSQLVAVVFDWKRCPDQATDTGNYPTLLRNAKNHFHYSVSPLIATPPPAEQTILEWLRISRKSGSLSLLVWPDRFSPELKIQKISQASSHTNLGINLTASLANARMFDGLVWENHVFPRHALGVLNCIVYIEACAEGAEVTLTLYAERPKLAKNF